MSSFSPFDGATSLPIRCWSQALAALSRRTDWMARSFNARLKVLMMVRA